MGVLQLKVPVNAQTTASNDSRLFETADARIILPIFDYDLICLDPQRNGNA